MVKSIVKLIEKISPNMTAKLAYYFISNPQVSKFREFEKPILEKAEKGTISFNQFEIATYKWGNGPKKALLVHGWEGRASNFGAIIPKLVDNGYEVISFDAPSHGNSTKKKASFFDFSDLIAIFLKKQPYDLIVTHSIGSVMSLLAMSTMKYEGDQMYILTTPDRFEEYVEYAVNHFGLTYKTKDAFLELVRNRAGYEPLDLNGSEFAKNVSFNKVIFIHDVADSTLHIDNSIRVQANMKNSELIKLEGTGHFRMLWSPKTVGIIEQASLEKTK